MEYLIAGLVALAVSAGIVYFVRRKSDGEAPIGGRGGPRDLPK